MIKFWPDTDKKGIEVVVEINGARVVAFLDLEDSYHAIDDLQNAILIVERSFPDILHNGVG